MRPKRTARADGRSARRLVDVRVVLLGLLAGAGVCAVGSPGGSPSVAHPGLPVVAHLGAGVGLGAGGVVEVALLALVPFGAVAAFVLESDRRRRSPASPSGAMANGLCRVPQVTAYFWLVKILTTGMGESTSDYLVHRFVPAYAVVPVAIVFGASLLLQLSARRYVAWIYWLAVAMVSVFGTMAADVVHVELHVPYAVSTVVFAATLVAVLFVWNRTEHTLSVHSITTQRRELFYWATVFTTFALGTAAGDLTAVTLHLGYFSSGLLFVGLIAMPALAYWRLHVNETLAFWAAYVLTRPLGASFADWLGVSQVRGGLAWGTGPVSLSLAVIIAGFVFLLAVTRRDVQPALATPA